ncbi:MAG: preprotein translocase subunit SecG [Caulobacterales bacterium]|nr:preprotein translocase subunit SecG [Caulobacterales bacterium]
MLQTILLVAMILVSIALTGVILLQRSEGGALGMGGGPSGFMTARGAGNLLTRATSILATLFFLLAIGLTVSGNMTRANRSVVDADAVGKLALGDEAPAAAAPQQPAPAAPAQNAAPSLEDLEASLPAAASAPASSSTQPQQ